MKHIVDKFWLILLFVSQACSTSNFEAFCSNLTSDSLCLNVSDSNKNNFSYNGQTNLYLDSGVYNFNNFSLLLSKNLTLQSYDENVVATIEFSKKFCFKFDFVEENFSFVLRNIRFMQVSSDFDTNEGDLCQNAFFNVLNNTVKKVSVVLDNLSFENLAIFGMPNSKLYFFSFLLRGNFFLRITNSIFANGSLGDFSFFQHFSYSNSIDKSIFDVAFSEAISITNLTFRELKIGHNSSIFEFLSDYNLIKFKNITFQNILISEIKAIFYVFSFQKTSYIFFTGLKFVNFYEMASISSSLVAPQKGLISIFVSALIQTVCSKCYFHNLTLNHIGIIHHGYIALYQKFFKENLMNSSIIQYSEFHNIILQENRFLYSEAETFRLLFCDFKGISSSIDFRSEGRIALNGHLTIKASNFSLEFVDSLFNIHPENENSQMQKVIFVEQCNFFNKFNKFGSFFYIEFDNLQFIFEKVTFSNFETDKVSVDNHPLLEISCYFCSGSFQEATFLNAEKFMLSSVSIRAADLSMTITNSTFVNNSQLSNTLSNNADIKIYCSNQAHLEIKNSTFKSFNSIDKKRTLIFGLNANISFTDCFFYNIRSKTFSSMIISNSVLMMSNCIIHSDLIDLLPKFYFVHALSSRINISDFKYIIQTDFLSQNFGSNSNGNLFYCSQSEFILKNSFFQDVMTNQSLISMFDSYGNNLVQNVSFNFTIINPITNLPINNILTNIFNGFSIFDLNSVRLTLDNLMIQTDFPIISSQDLMISKFFDLFFPESLTEIGGIGQGFVLKAEKSDVFLVNSSIRNIFSVKGGSCYFINSNFTLVNSTFTDTTAILFASFLFKNCPKITITNNTFINNGGYAYGTFYIDQDNNDFKDFQYISNNIFNTTSHHYFINVTHNIQNPMLKKYLLECELNLNNNETYATIHYNNMYIGNYLNVMLENNNVTSFYLPNGNGRFITSLNPSFLNISGLVAKNIVSNSNDMYLNIFKNFFVRNNTFIEVTASSSIITLSNCMFENYMFFDAYGGVLLIWSDPVKISTVMFLNCSFKNISIYGSGEGGAFYFDSVRGFFEDCIFLNCSAPQYGGAISMLSSEITFIKSSFENCTSLMGGAIFWKAIEPRLESSVLFKNNWAYYGNHIATNIFQRKIFCFNKAPSANDFLSKGLKVTFSEAPSKFTIIDNSTNSSNFIRKSWMDINPSDFFNDSKVETFFNNNRSNTIFNFSCLNKSNLILKDLFNGSLILASFDIYDQYVDMNLWKNLIKLDFASNNNTQAELNAVDFDFTAGLILISYFKFDFPVQNGGINANFAKEVSIDEPLNVTSKSFSNTFSKYQDNSSFKLYSLNDVNISFPVCELGQVYSGYLCINCSGTLYSRNNSETQCTKIPSNAYKGCGQNIFPLADYWIGQNLSNITQPSITITQCFYAQACNNTRGDDNMTNFCEHSQTIYETPCVEGYVGSVCTSCNFSYARSSTKYHCERCTDNTVLYSILLMLVIFAFYLYLVFTSRDYTTKIPITELMKILSNFIIFYTVAFKRLDNIDEYKDFIKRANDIIGVTQGIVTPNSLFSYKCLFNKLTDSEDYDVHGKLTHQTSNNLFFLEKLFILMTPVFFYVLFIIIELLILKSKKGGLKKYTIWGLLINNIFVIHFVFFNDVVRVCLTFFNTQKINDVEVLDDEMMIRRDDPNCQKMFIFVSIYMLIYALLIPALGFFLLWKHKRTHNNPRFKEKYGFLYVGYHYKVYFWEFVINIFKVLMLVMETNIFQNFSSALLDLKDFDKSVLALVFLFVIRAVYFFLVASIFPFKSKFLNLLEVRACFLSLIILILILIPKYFFIFPEKIYGSQAMYFYFTNANDINSENNDYQWIISIKRIIGDSVIVLLIVIFIYVILYIIQNILRDLFSVFKDTITVILKNKCIENYTNKCSATMTNFKNWILKYKWLRKCLEKIVPKMKLAHSNDTIIKNEFGGMEDLEKIEKLNNYVRVLHILNKKYMIKNFVKFLKIKGVNFNYRMFKRSITVIKNFLEECHYILPQMKKNTLMKIQTSEKAKEKEK